MELSPLQRKKNVQKIISVNYKLDNWLLKRGIIDKKNDGNKVKSNSTMSATDYGSKENEKFKRKRAQVPKSLKLTKEPAKQKYHIEKPLNSRVMESFVINEHKNSKCKTIRKASSNESYDLPSFKDNNSVPKRNKLCKKYGVILPTVEEILQEKKDLEVYKNQLEAFQDINEYNILSLNKGKQCLEVTEEILDCKHLSLKHISKFVRKNLAFLKDIMCGRVFNERHERFSDKYKKPLTLSTKDLTYNTSMILFTYEQTEYMISKLQKYLDPEDKLTHYFFQVLLPELCLRIFMEEHNMNYEQAVMYLDSRPISENC